MRMIEFNRAKLQTTKCGKRPSIVTQTLKTSIQITLVFIFCYTPFILDGLLFLLNMYKINTFYSKWVCKDCDTIMYLRHFIKVFLIYLNGVINPFLYGTTVIQGKDDLIAELPGYIKRARRSTRSFLKKMSLANIPQPLNRIEEGKEEGEIAGPYSPVGSPLLEQTEQEIS